MEIDHWRRGTEKGRGKVQVLGEQEKERGSFCSWGRKIIYEGCGKALKGI